MRIIYESVTKQRQPKLCQRWLSHLNFQLYKALEYQYQFCLESLNEHLPEINTDLIFKDNAVLFRPTYEELKHKYY